MMKDRVLNINRAKLTSQMGFGKRDSYSNPPAQKATGRKIKEKLSFPSPICFFILNSHLMSNISYGEKLKAKNFYFNVFSG